ncbi:NERD domain-containing protein [Schleiferiaceae bacterium]|nr:NERD domain-containing protein [Schleiferiaceae bacterium]
MAHIFRQIDSTKSLRAELDRRNISMFNSIREIEDFNRNYKSISEDILAQANINLQKNIAQKSTKLESLEADLISHRKSHEGVLKKQIFSLDTKVSDLSERLKNAPLLEGLFLNIYRWYKNSKLRQLIRNRDKIISNRTASMVHEVESLRADINRLNQNSDEIVSLDCKNELHELERTKKAVSELRTIIAGAKGEHAVEQELKNLPYNFYVINDYRLNFNRPIINKRTGEKIFSIQIDHLVVSPGGVFILETKNWSRRSIESLNLRSPIEQIQRSSYALYVFINNNISINSHHWGSKHISLKNILVMTGASTNQKFQYVKVKHLEELNVYLKYFDAVYSDNETKWLASALLDYCD